MRVVDFWLFLVLTSIANTSLILIRILGFNYFNVIFLYLFIIVIIIYYFFSADSLVEIAFIVFFFIVVPPFLLFFLKFYVAKPFRARSKTRFAKMEDIRSKIS